MTNCPSTGFPVLVFLALAHRVVDVHSAVCGEAVDGVILVEEPTLLTATRVILSVESEASTVESPKRNISTTEEKESKNTKAQIALTDRLPLGCCVLSIFDRVASFDSSSATRASKLIDRDSHGLPGGGVDGDTNASITLTDTAASKEVGEGCSRRSFGTELVSAAEVLDSVMNPGATIIQSTPLWLTLVRGVNCALVPQEEPSLRESMAAQQRNACVFFVVLNFWMDGEGDECKAVKDLGNTWQKKMKNSSAD